jgi:hypothetical protein
MKILKLFASITALLLSGSAMADPYGLACNGTIYRNGQGYCGWKTTTASELNLAIISNNALQFVDGKTSRVEQGNNYINGIYFYGTGKKTGVATICVYDVLRYKASCAQIRII